MAGTIGIKVADGSFYPIAGENSAVRKQLVLTTVRDNQSGVRIALYRSASRSMLDARYIGNLAVEGIRPCRKGEPSIEMIISSDADGNISAEAYDLDASPDSDHHFLNVSLRTMDAMTKPEDFPDLDDLDDDFADAEVSPGKPQSGGRKRRSFLPIFAVLALLAILTVVALCFFLPRGGDGDSRPRLLRWRRAFSSALVIPSAPAVPEAPHPPSAPAVPEARPPSAPHVLPATGAMRVVLWGDTLWDISAEFYGTPLLYVHIARHNGIANPNRLAAGTVIRIPPLAPAGE